MEVVPSTKIVEYSKTEAALSDLASRFKGVLFDVKTREGLKAATEARREIRSYRTSLEAKRVEIKAPALERCNLIDSEARRIKTALEALEDPIDAQIKREEQRVQEAKDAAIRAEQERLAAEERARKEAEQKALADARAKLEAEQAELARQQAALKEAQEKAERERQEAEAAARRKQEDEERAARVRREEEDRAARAARDEADRKAREQQERNAAAVSEVQGIQQQVIIAQCGRLGVRAGGTIACIEETLAETEAWPVDAEHFGIFYPAAVKAKETAVEQIRALLAAALAREAESAKMKEERERLEAERLAAEEAQRKARIAKELKEAAERRAAEERERAEREKAEAEERAVEERKRKEQEAEEARKRELLRQQAELLDGRAFLETFVNRFGHREEFGFVVVAARTYLEKKPSKQKAA